MSAYLGGMLRDHSQRRMEKLKAPILVLTPSVGQGGWVELLTTEAASPLQLRAVCRLWGPSFMMSGPGRISWQPRSRRHKPCWPWTQVCGFSLFLPVTLLYSVVPRESRHMPNESVHAVVSVSDEAHVLRDTLGLCL